MSRTRRQNPWLYGYAPTAGGRDRKPWYKPGKAWKKLSKKKQKAEAKEALRQGREPERQRHSDVYYYA